MCSVVNVLLSSWESCLQANIFISGCNGTRTLNQIKFLQMLNYISKKHKNIIFTMKIVQYNFFYLFNVKNCKQRDKPTINAFTKNKISGVDTNFDSFIKPKSKTTLVYMILQYMILQYMIFQFLFSMNVLRVLIKFSF